MDVNWDRCLHNTWHLSIKAAGTQSGSKSSQPVQRFSLLAISLKAAERHWMLVPSQLPGKYHENPVSVVSADSTGCSLRGQNKPPTLPSRAWCDPQLYGKCSATASTAMTLQENLLPNNLVFIYPEEKITDIKKAQRWRLMRTGRGIILQ